MFKSLENMVYLLDSHYFLWITIVRAYEITQQLHNTIFDLKGGIKFFSTLTGQRTKRDFERMHKLILFVLF